MRDEERIRKLLQASPYSIPEDGLEAYESEKHSTDGVAGKDVSRGL